MAKIYIVSEVIPSYDNNTAFWPMEAFFSKADAVAYLRDYCKDIATSIDKSQVTDMLDKYGCLSIDYGSYSTHFEIKEMEVK